MTPMLVVYLSKNLLGGIMKKKRFYILYLHNGHKVAEVIEDLTLRSVINRLYNELGKIFIVESEVLT